MAFVFGSLSAEAIGALTGGAAEALPYIVQGVDIGLSANLTQQALTAAGMGIRRANLLTLIRGIKAGGAGAAYQKSLSPNDLPNPQFFTGAESFLSRKYAYIVTVTGHDVFTGMTQQQQITISTDNVLTNTELDGAVADSMEAGIATYQMTLDTYDLERVLVDPRFLP